MPARVYVTELLGNETLVFLNVGREKICVRAAADFAADTGLPVNLRCVGAKAIFFAPDGGAILSTAAQVSTQSGSDGPAHNSNARLE